MKIIHFSAECYPAAKVGGLADVIGALPKYQNNLGIETKVVIPFYDNKFTKNNKFKLNYRDTIQIDDTKYKSEVLILQNQNSGYPLYLIKVYGLLDRENIYEYKDDTERFMAFQKAALNWVLQLDKKPTIIHCHDHHVGLIPFMMSNTYKYRILRNIPTVLTIHNAQYQGQFSFDKINYLPKYELSNSKLLEWNKRINPLASAIKCSWAITTVSPSYLLELRNKANGLESLIDNEREKSYGILNGIDTNLWNPATDIMIPKNFSIQNSLSGKRDNKLVLSKKFNLDPKKPLFSFIGRLVKEKGAELLPEIIKNSLNNPKIKLNILILGSGNSSIEKSLNNLKEKNKENYNTYIGHNEELSHLIYAGSDFLLMPSRVEPCGLNQMYSLRYGTIPVVRSIGGLKDTVIDINNENGFGICYEEITITQTCNAILRACELYEEKPKLKKIRKQIMKIDHSWKKSANNYINLYKTLIR